MDRSTLRLFFALWPDATTQSAMSELAQRVTGETGGKATMTAHLHLTLAFLGDIAAARLTAARRVASVVRAPPFQLTFDEIGCFRKAGITWLGARARPAALDQLQSALAAGLAAAGFVLDERPFAPHITLARHIRVAVQRSLAEPLRWNVGSFELMVSEPGRSGPSYRVLHDWPLVAAA